MIKDVPCRWVSIIAIGDFELSVIFCGTFLAIRKYDDSLLVIIA